MRVAICIATYHRAEGLRRLLEGLAILIFNKSEPPDIEIIVVDNDASGSAQAICNSVGRSLKKLSIKYHIEPCRGISYARNAAIAKAENVDFLAFIDDDEVPEPTWLDELLYVQQLYNADVVAGPVLPYYDESVPDWVIRGEFFGGPFEQRRYPTGQLIDIVAAGNVLVRAKVFKRMDTIFDPRWGLTGGEDVHFFSRVYRAGYKMIWADEAVAHEWIPRSRANAKFILKRAYRLGLTHSMWETYFESSTKVRALRGVKAVAWIARGLLLVPLYPALGRHILMRALQYVCRGTGMLAALVGIRYEIYK